MAIEGSRKTIKNEFINEYHLTTECAFCDYCDSLNFQEGTIKYSAILRFPKELQNLNIDPTDQKDRCLKKINGPTKDQIELIYEKLSEIKKKFIQTKIGFEFSFDK